MSEDNGPTRFEAEAWAEDYVEEQQIVMKAGGKRKRRGEVRADVLKMYPQIALWLLWLIVSMIWNRLNEKKDG